MKELFEKIYIKSEADLPKEDGLFIAHSIASNLIYGIEYYPSIKRGQKEGWIESIDWYLLPLASVDNRPEKKDNVKGKNEIPNGEKWNKLLNKLQKYGVDNADYEYFKDIFFASQNTLQGKKKKKSAEEILEDAGLPCFGRRTSVKEDFKKKEDKQLANWIFWEEGEYYCSECIEIRLRDINKNREFSKYIDYDNGEDCGYYQDYALEDYEVECCICGHPLFSKIDC